MKLKPLRYRNVDLDGTERSGIVVERREATAPGGMLYRLDLIDLSKLHHQDGFGWQGTVRKNGEVLRGGHYIDRSFDKARSRLNGWRRMRLQRYLTLRQEFEPERESA